MKDWGIYSGTGLSTYCIYLNLNDSLTRLAWWELVLVGIFFLIKIVFWAIVCGVVATIIQETINDAKEQWIGKRKALKPHT